MYPCVILSLKDTVNWLRIDIICSGNRKYFEKLSKKQLSYTYEETIWQLVLGPIHMYPDNYYLILSEENFIR